MSYFDGVIGQKAIIDRLSTAVSNKALPHSLLFAGEAGLGKLATAIGLASLIMGRQVFSADGGQSFLAKIEGDPVIYTDRGDAFWLRPIKNVLKVEQWYTLLNGYLTQKGQGARVVIVEDFQTANAVMANAMLKTIEEPPEDVYFIIITNRPASVLPTIRSRCMYIAFEPVADEDIREALEKQGITSDLTAALAAGHGNPALVQLLATQEGLPLLATAMDVLEGLTGRLFFAELSLTLEPLSRDELREVWHWLRLLARDMMVLRFGGTDDLLQCPTYKWRLLKILDTWSAAALTALLRITIDADEALRLYVKPALVVDGVLIKLRQAMKEDTR